MKYIVVETWNDGEIFTEEFENKDEAILWAKRSWGYTTQKERKGLELYVLESANPDPDSHIDGESDRQCLLWRTCRK